jgi:hypothetical protein
MTVPAERTRAVILARDFLVALACPSGIKRIPTAVRQQARSLLKHYPIWADLGRDDVWDESTAERTAKQLEDENILMPWGRP